MSDSTTVVDRGRRLTAGSVVTCATVALVMSLIAQSAVVFFFADTDRGEGAQFFRGLILLGLPGLVVGGGLEGVIHGRGHGGDPASAFGSVVATVVNTALYTVLLCGICRLFLLFRRGTSTTQKG